MAAAKEVLGFPVNVERGRRASGAGVRVDPTSDTGFSGLTHDMRRRLLTARVEADVAALPAWNRFHEDVRPEALFEWDPAADLLGRGTCGDVYRVRRKGGGGGPGGTQQFALKLVTDPAYHEDTLREIAVNKRIGHHANTVQIEEAFVFWESVARLDASTFQGVRYRTDVDAELNVNGAWQEARIVRPGSDGMLDVNTWVGPVLRTISVRPGDVRVKAVAMVLELCGRRTLHDLVADTVGRRRRAWPEWAVAHVCRDVLRGLACLHANGIVHRDLKSANLLYMPASGAVKIADFGFSKQAHRDKMLQSHCGTPFFMAPELLQGKAYSDKVDIWALGITACHVATGAVPHQHTHGGGGGGPDGLKRAILECKAPPELGPGRSPALHDFVARCLRRNPKKRPSVAQLLKHPFLEGHACGDADDFKRFVRDSSTDTNW